MGESDNAEQALRVPETNPGKLSSLVTAIRRRFGGENTKNKPATPEEQIAAERAKIQASTDKLSQIGMDPIRADAAISDAEKAKIDIARENIAKIQIKQGSPMLGAKEYAKPWAEPQGVTTIPVTKADAPNEKATQEPIAA